MFGLGLIALLVGVVLWAATTLTTLGIVLTIIGGVLVAVNLIFVLLAIATAILIARSGNTTRTVRKRLR